MLVVLLVYNWGRKYCLQLDLLSSALRTNAGADNARDAQARNKSVVVFILCLCSLVGRCLKCGDRSFERAKDVPTR